MTWLFSACKIHCVELHCPRSAPSPFYLLRLLLKLEVFCIDLAIPASGSRTSSRRMSSYSLSMPSRPSAASSLELFFATSSTEVVALSSPTNAAPSHRARPSHRLGKKNNRKGT